MNMCRTVLLLAILCLGASGVQAQSAAAVAAASGKSAPADASFAQKKQKAIELIGAKSVRLQTAHACVQAATDAAALKSCHSANAAHKR